MGPKILCASTNRGDSMKHIPMAITTMAAIVLATSLAQAQVPAPAPAQGERGARGRGQAQPAVVSPEVSTDRRITFRLLAPLAQGVRLTVFDIPNLGQTAAYDKV